MFFKRFLAFFVVLFSISLMVLVFCLANLSEARFDLNEDKIFDAEDLDYSYTPKYVIIFNGGESKPYMPFGAGLLRLITGAEIQKNGWGKELIVKTEPFWLFVLLFYVFVIFFTILAVKELIRRRF